MIEKLRELLPEENIELLRGPCWQQEKMIKKYPDGVIAHLSSDVWPNASQVANYLRATNLPNLLYN
jgi:hypothetical protein